MALNMAKVFILVAILIPTVLTMCTWDEYACSNGNCIDPRKKCDGTNDCGDYSDENARAECKNDCENGNFRCGTGKCIDRSYRCDGHSDCADGSDESSAAGCVISNWFKCHMCTSSSLLVGECGDPFNGTSAITFCQHGCHKVKAETNGVVTIRRQCMPLGAEDACERNRVDSMYGSGEVSTCGCLGDLCNAADRLPGLHMRLVALISFSVISVL